MGEVSESMELVGLGLAAIMILLLVVAIPLSVSRNRKSIDAFDDQSIDELHICIPDYRLKALTAKLDRMGWNTTQGARDAKNPGHFQTCIKRRDEAEAASLKQVLHKLNRMLVLPVSPLDLKRIGEDET